ncbi:MAG TPA: CapA family protein [Myxococcota bacterium]|nr:CapA family protein [Myxococcota bacterium]
MASTAALGGLTATGCGSGEPRPPTPSASSPGSSSSPSSSPPSSASSSRRQPGGEPARAPATLFLCGDVMTARGIDQILPHPGDPRLREPFVQSAREYVALAEQENGPIPRPLDFAYPWGAALEELDEREPDVRIINLETAVTQASDWADKSIHYRMHPANVPVISAAGVDCCVLANNHVLDFGRPGLLETLDVLQDTGLPTVGAGRNAAEAAAPAILDLPEDRRLVVLAFGSTTSGIPNDWAAAEGRPGVSLLEESDVEAIAARIGAVRRPGDVVVVSIHWGGNWGYAIPEWQRRLAHRLVEKAGVDIVHGHSSHHFKAIERHGDGLILYGCGDFLNDYEGISGYEELRPDLVLMFFVTLDAVARPRLTVVPLRIARLQLERPTPEETAWVRRRLERECGRFGGRVREDEAGALELEWD